jgi:hypothetical protein
MSKTNIKTLAVMLLCLAVSTIAHNRVTLTTKNGVIALPFKE